MTELEVMQRAKMYMDKLAAGIDPITGRPLPPDSGLDQPRLGRCFSYVSQVLGRVIANEGYVGAIPKIYEFRITPEQLARVQLSQEPVRVSQIIDAVMAAIGEPRMKKLSSTVVTNWLENKGYLEKQTTPDGKSRRIPTSSGAALGITTRSRQGQYGDYEAVYYDSSAQRFILGHLQEMIQ